MSTSDETRPLATGRHWVPIAFVVLILVVGPYALFSSFGVARVYGWIDQFDLAGLFLVVAAMNVFIQPISPDLLIMAAPAILSNRTVHEIAAVSAFAGLASGVTGYGLGYLLGDRGLRRAFSSDTIERGRELSARYGAWAIVVTAVTPFPFSVVCWLSGAFRLRRDHFLLAVIASRSSRHVLVAYSGASILEWARHYW